MAVTIRQVAEAAGVSTAAVSKVLHGRGNSIRVSEERAKQIRQVAAELNYHPNLLARNLRLNRTHAVGLIFDNLWNISGGPLYHMHLLDGVASPLFHKHYRLTILPEVPEDDILGSLGDGQLEGVIWCKLPRTPQMMEVVRRCPIPIVALTPPPPDPVEGTRFVSCDNGGGIRLAMEHLRTLGHTRIGFLCEEVERENPDSVERREAFLRFQRECGIDATNDCFFWSWDLDEFRGWWRSRPPVTAMVCWSESLAGRLMIEGRNRGLLIPDDLSVVGFDSTQYCETTQPPLTAVRQPIFEMARYASEMLLRILAGEEVETPIKVFPCSLDVRRSTACPRKSWLK